MDGVVVPAKETLPDLTMEGNADSKQVPTDVKKDVQNEEDRKTAALKGEKESEKKDTQAVNAVDGTQAPRSKYKKRKVALFFAYIGAGYQGMQRNPGAKTIEGELEAALFKAGAITKDNFGDPKKVHWMRSARTDKGVSAVGQVVSGKFIVDPPGLVERLNEALPEKIRCFGYRRVTNGFDARTNCDRRRYEYVIPSFALDPEAYRERDYYNLRAARKEIEDAKAAASNEGVKQEANSDIKSESEPQVRAKVMLGVNSDDPSSVGPSAVQIESGEALPGTSQGEQMELKRPGEGQPGVGRERDAEEEQEGPAAKRVKIESGLNEGIGAKAGLEPNAKPASTETPQAQTQKESVGPVTLPEPGLEAGLEPKPGVTNGVSAEKGSEKGPDATDPTLAEVDRFLVTETEKGNPMSGVPTQPFRYTPAVQKRLNGLLAKYTGTHNFHNFTTRVKANDGQAQRYILSFNAGPPFKIDGVEHVRLTVVGQSFMLHQIRKMVGLVLAVVRNVISDDVIDYALRKDKEFLVPVAPELGLFLEESIFGAYNKKFGADHEELTLKDFKQQVADFKEKYVYKHIAQTEKEEGVMATWLKTLNEKNYRDFAAANARAVEQEDAEICDAH